MFEYEQENYEISCEEYIEIIKDINIMFDKIIMRLVEFKERYDQNHNELLFHTC